MSNIDILLEDLRRRLVETGTRNRLIHVNRQNKRSKAIPIIDERSEDIFEILRTQEKKMQFYPKGIEEEGASELRLGLNEEPVIDESRFRDKFLDTPFTRDTLQKKLLHIARDARTAEEERGISTLYLAMGFLKWFEAEKSDIAREAPLILIPVNLVRNKRTSSFDVETRDDDIVTNLPLQERLLNDFGIKLPEIDDSVEWSPNEYFRKVSEVIQNQSKWEIDNNGMQVGFFSFAKLLMYNDLNPKEWHSESFLRNPLIQGLLEDGFQSDPPLFTEDTNLDEILKFDDLLHVIEADTSQTKVIQEVRAGRNLVVQGPPGTGKSQTITNILAAAVHDGKKVLFVAEKMAALNVVRRRMEKLELKDLCIELHSRNANKRAFFEELKNTLSRKTETFAPLKNVDLHIETRDQLNEISKALHQNVKGTDYTPFCVLSKLIKFSGDETPPSNFQSSILEDMDTNEENRILNAIEAFQAIHLEGIDFGKHPFRYVQNLALQPPDIRRAVSEIEAAIQAIEALQENVQTVSQKCGLDESPDSLAKIEALTKFMSAINNAPAVDDDATWEICLRE